jgi:hypothetical protein
MKILLKKLSYLIVLLALFSFVSEANAAFERREEREMNKFKDPFVKSSESKGKVIATDEGDIDPGDRGDALGSPVGDSVGILLGLSLTYGLYLFERKRENNSLNLPANK